MLSKINALWLMLKSNKLFVAFEGAVLGSLGDSVMTAVQAGHFDFSPAALKQYGLTAIAAGFVAVRMLKRPAPAQKDAIPGQAPLAAAFVAALVLLSMSGSMAVAQNVNTLYLGGVSFNPSATPKAAGTALAAHEVSGNTYMFAIFDAVPVNGKISTVTSNVGVGVAQKLFSFAGHDIYVPTSAGVQWQGPNVGWQWSTGAGAAFKFHDAKDSAYYVMPTVRVLKGSASAGAGYQLVPGILVGWGK